MHDSLPFVPEDVYHPALSISCSFTAPARLLETIESSKKWNFRKCNFTMLNEHLSSIDWAFLEHCELDVGIDMFYSILYRLFEECVPLKKVFASNRFPCWFSRSTVNLLNRKNRAYQLYKKSKKSEHYLNFSTLRSQSKSAIKSDYDKFILSTEDRVHENVQHIWSFMKSKQKQDGYPRTMNDSVQGILPNDSVVANAFVEVFQSNFTSPMVNSYEPFTTLSPNDVLCNFDLVESVILEKLLLLDVNMAPGPDQVPSSVLKCCAENFVKPLYLLFSKSLSTGEMPNIWKISYVIPVHKKGDRSMVNNYRPISKLSSIPKLFESILTDQLSSHFRSYLSEKQHGFVVGKSTSTNLLLFREFLIDSVENGFQVDAIYTDLAKAFDSVDHNRLLYKLNSLGIVGSPYNWLKSYLTNRRSYVVFRDHLSRELSVSSGVPQGSHLGPILFLLYFNDVFNSCSSAMMLAFADDVKIFQRVRNESDCLALNADVARFSEWCSLNGLKVEVSKCMAISFSRKTSPIIFDYSVSGHTLSRVTSVRDLGVIFDDRLTFGLHIENVVARSYRMVGFIRRSTQDFKNVQTVRSLYFAYVQSLHDYACAVWQPFHACHFKELDRVQKSAIKHLCFIEKKDLFDSKTIVQWRSHFHLLSPSARMQYLNTCLLWKLINGNIDCSQLLDLMTFHVPNRSLRNSKLFSASFHRTEYGLNQTFSRLLRSHNDLESVLDIDLFFQSLATVKRLLMDHFLIA